MKNRFTTALLEGLLFPYRALRWMMLARPIRFTRFGTFYILFSIGVGAAAINTGNNLLYLILGILLGFIVISGFLSDSGLWGLRAEWVPLTSLFAGEKARFEGRVTKGWFPGVAISVESFWKGLAPTTCFIPWVPARGQALIQTDVSPARRGTLTLERCVVSTPFPFGLFQKSHTWVVNDRWIVYPAIRTLPSHLLDRRGDNPAPQDSGRVGIGSTPFALRDYRTGDSLRHVNWKTSAKRQRLMVKETEEEASAGDLFVLNAWPSGLSEADLDRLISFIASLVFTIHGRGRPVGLATPEATFEPEASRQQLRRILEFLALVDPYQKKEKTYSARPSLSQGRVTDILVLWSRGKSGYEL